MVRERLLDALKLSGEELRFSACVVGHEHVKGLNGFGYVKAGDKLIDLKKATRATTTLAWLKAWERERRLELAAASKKNKVEAAAKLAEISLCIKQSDMLLKLFGTKSAEDVHAPREVRLVPNGIYESHAKRFLCERKDDGSLRRKKLFERMQARGFKFSAATEAEAAERKSSDAPTFKNHQEKRVGQQAARKAISVSRTKKAICPKKDFFGFREDDYKELAKGTFISFIQCLTKIAEPAGSNERESAGDTTAVTSQRKSCKGKARALPGGNSKSGSKKYTDDWKYRFAIHTLTAGWIDPLLLPEMKEEMFSEFVVKLAKEMRVSSDTGCLRHLTNIDYAKHGVV